MVLEAERTCGGGKLILWGKIILMRFLISQHKNDLTQMRGLILRRNLLRGQSLVLSGVSPRGGWLLTAVVVVALVWGVSAPVEAQQSVCSSTPDTVACDREALEALYDSTDGANWTTNTNWTTAMPLDEWYGITTDSSGRVTRLEVNNNNLVGVIPTELSHLSQLEHLQLGFNSLTGSIPDLSNMTNLSHLYIYFNQLSGTIPSWLGNLPNLQVLALSRNDLTGEIPSFLGNLQNLTELSFENNDLTGVIPSSLGNLQNLERLYLSSNKLTGEIPSSLANLNPASMTDLRVSYNNLSSAIPDFGGLIRLKSLFLGGNDFTAGDIPSWIRTLTDLEWLFLEEMNLTGEVHFWLTELTSLKWLTLYHNDLSGPIPDLGSLELRWLLLGGNDFTAGDIPAWIRNFTNLRNLYLYDMNLTGEVPAWLNERTSLNWLSLHHNDLSGPIPDLSDLTELRWLLLGGNDFTTGNFPSWIRNLTNLENLFLHDTNLTGKVPAWLTDLTMLQALTLSNNDLCFPTRRLAIALEDLRSEYDQPEPITDCRRPPRRGVTIPDAYVDDQGIEETAFNTLAHKGITAKTECRARHICPDWAIQRWTLAVWLAQAWGMDPPAEVASSRFTDVDPNQWWAPYVEHLFELGFTKGCAVEPARFCPEQLVTRAEMASFLARALQIQPASHLIYQDTIGNSHAGNIGAIMLANIAQGCASQPTSYCPDQSLTRGHMAIHLARALGYMYIPLPTP